MLCRTSACMGAQILQHKVYINLVKAPSQSARSPQKYTTDGSILALRPLQDKPS